MFYLTICEWSVDREGSLTLEYQKLKTMLGILPRLEGLKFKQKLFLSTPKELLYTINKTVNGRAVLEFFILVICVKFLYWFLVNFTEIFFADELKIKPDMKMTLFT